MKIELTTEKGPRDVRVTEAAVNIPDGQDLREIVDAICGGAKNAVQALLAPKILQAQNEGRSTPWLRGDAIYADFAIVECEWWINGRCEECYYRVPWSQAADGTLTFGQAEEVREITTYEPVTTSEPAAPSTDAPMMEQLERKAQSALGLLRQSVLIGGTQLRADAERTAESLLRDAPAGSLQPVREALAALRGGERTKVLQLTAAAR